MWCRIGTGLEHNTFICLHETTTSIWCGPFTLLHNKPWSVANNKSILRTRYRLLIHKNINKSTTCRFMCGSRIPSAVGAPLCDYMCSSEDMENGMACCQATIKMLLCSIGNRWARLRDWLSFQALNMKDGMYSDLWKFFCGQCQMN